MGKGRLVGIIFFTVNAVFSREAGKRSTMGQVNPNLVNINSNCDICPLISENRAAAKFSTETLAQSA